jgi:hypothetical protein
MAFPSTTIQFRIPSSSEPPPPGSDEDPFVSSYKLMHSSSGSGYQTEVSLLEPRSWLVKAENLTTHNAWQVDLNYEYGELAEVLTDLADRPEEDEWRINRSIYDAASSVVSWLKDKAVQVPQVLVHGPTSVVFNWTKADQNLYLTVGSEYVSALTTTPERILDCKEYSWSDWPKLIQNSLPIRNALLPGVYVSGPEAVTDQDAGSNFLTYLG